RRRHTRSKRDWSSDVCSSDLIYETSFIRDGRIRSGKLVGVNRHYFDINNFELAEGGRFTTKQIENAERVCVIGSDVRARFFAGRSEERRVGTGCCEWVEGGCC